MTRRDSSSLNGKPKMLFLGLLGPLGSNWDRSVMFGGVSLLPLVQMKAQVSVVWNYDKIPYFCHRGKSCLSIPYAKGWVVQNKQTMDMKKVVVTGIGAVTPLGNDVGTFWAGLIAGRSGAGPITHFNPALFKTRFACEVKSFD